MLPQSHSEIVPYTPASSSGDPISDRRRSLRTIFYLIRVSRGITPKPPQQQSIRCLPAAIDSSTNSTSSTTSPWPPPTHSKPSTYPAPAAYKDYSPKPPRSTPPSHPEFSSNSAAQTPADTDSARSFPRPASTAAKPS